VIKPSGLAVGNVMQYYAIPQKLNREAAFRLHETG
jgi:hypothetical protein